MSDFETLLRSPLQRREFLARMTAAGLGTAALSLLAGCGSNDDGGLGPVRQFDPQNFPGIPGSTADQVVLNYALSLEILEADLYRQALNLASGRDIAAPLDANVPTGPNDTGNYVLTISPGNINSNLVLPAFAYLAQYAYVEAAHRDFLQIVLQSLGLRGDQIVQPNARGYRANFGNTLSSILDVIYAVEETGVRAYLGAAGFINDVQLLTTAVAIHSTEARHSGVIAYVTGRPAGPTYLPGDLNVLNNTANPNPPPYAQNTFQYYLPPTTVLNAVQPFIIA